MQAGLAATAGVSPSGTRRTAIAVDDDPVILKILDRLFRGLHVCASTATRAYGLLNMIVAQRPALVVLDVNLPGLDGPSLVSLVRRDPEIASTTIVLHSSLDERTLAKKAAQCGANGYISKSRGLVHLQHSLEFWLRR
jgi:two-component system response regulator FimZ (fimbrial Z protein)